MEEELRSLESGHDRPRAGLSRPYILELPKVGIIIPVL